MRMWERGLFFFRSEYLLIVYARLICEVFKVSTYQMLQDIRLPELEQSAKDVLYYHGCGWKNQRHVAIINTWLLYRDPLGAVKD